MMDTGKISEQAVIHNQLKNYYRFHSYIYDATRWSFLFGRKEIIQLLPRLPSNPKILDIGCGTGNNLKALANRYPSAELVGIDLSSDMLKKAEAKLTAYPQVSLIHSSYGASNISNQSFDLIFLSYSMTMFGQNYSTICNELSSDLAKGGYIAVVDFGSTAMNWFKKWMALNHVDLSGTLPEVLKNYFQTQELIERNAFAGLWSYFIFVGK